jgi:CubicO group peptidase (beta-lactamase class C family)
MTARDWATFGEFVRLGGTWKGKELIEAKALAECFHGTEQNPAYGLAWWLREPVKPELLRSIPLLRREWGGLLEAEWVPDDLVAACGAGKQRLYVMPSRKLVVVRQGALSQSFEDAEFLSQLLRSKPAE